MWKHAGGARAWWSVHFSEGDICHSHRPLCVLSHRHFLQPSSTGTLGFVTSNLILDGLAGWHGDRTGRASLSVNGCAMSVRHSQAITSPAKQLVCVAACISCH